ncbi:MAG: FAD binding domain-containing protein, partial [Syntrophorhabdaceae bacterium]|nr:FAD binding domain-containing protein [Syntrophorhabdaceae bacterium]
IMGGGTELLPRMKLRLINPEHIISVLNIKELGKIKINKEKEIEIGASVKIADISGFFLKNKQFHSIYQASEMVATQQIRNMATVGGNIFQHTRCKFYNRSWQWQKTVPPCYKRGGNVCHAVKNSKKCFAVYQGDLAPALISLDARAVFLSANHQKILPIEKIFTGNGIEPFNIKDSVLIKIILSENQGDYFSIYKKYRIRNGMDFPLAGVAAAVKFKNRKVCDIKLCLTGISQAPVVLKFSEDFIFKRKIYKDLAFEIADMAYKHAHPVDNVEGNHETRRLMIKQMVFDALTEIIMKYGI